MYRNAMWTELGARGVGDMVWSAGGSEEEEEEEEGEGEDGAGLKRGMAMGIICSVGACDRVSKQREREQGLENTRTGKRLSRVLQTQTLSRIAKSPLHTHQSIKPPIKFGRTDPLVTPGRDSQSPVTRKGNAGRFSIFLAVVARTSFAIDHDDEQRRPSRGRKSHTAPSTKLLLQVITPSCV